MDSLRGLAALLVVFYHTRLATHDNAPPWPVFWVFSGNQAVCLFFVLSGFVLCHPFLKRSPGRYRNYLLRRVVRVYIPYLAALALALAGYLIFRHHGVHASEWFALTWHAPLTVPLVAEHLLMVPSATLNTAFWSLNFEMVASVLLPGIVFAMLKTKWSSAIPLALGLAFVPVWLDDPRNLREWPGITLQVLSMFALGVWLAQRREWISRKLMLRPIVQYVVLFTSLLAYFGYPLFLRHSLHAWIPTHRAWPVYALGAAGIILCSLEIREFSRVLTHWLPEYLGEISYSLYLTHSVVLFSLFDLLYGRVATSILEGLVVGCSLAAAHTFYLLVERPCIQMTRSIKTRDLSREQTQPVAVLR